MNREVLKLESAESTDRLLDRLGEYNAEGQIHGLMVVFFNKEGNINTHWAAVPSVTRAVGALERLKIAILSDAGDT